MRITESRLKEIIREEIEIRFVKNTINEVINEMQLDLSEEQRLLLEKTVLDQIKSAAKKFAVPAAVVAALAFGSQIGSDLQVLDGVGATPAAAEQIQNAIDASQNMSDARSDFLQGAIDASGREGEIPADLAKGVGGDEAKDIAMDRLEAEYASKGDIESTGQAQQTADGASYITYVPYDSLPDGYKDTFTRGAEKEDLKKYYQTMEIQELADLVRDFNQWGSEGQGNFYDSESTGTQLLPASWSIAYKALQDKTAERGAKGKNTFKEVLDSAML
tara:strand:- start:51 stop:875 length:825 start_codon:yes stop_codon:yes gene_type:complete